MTPAITHVDAVLVAYLRERFSDPAAILSAMVKKYQKHQSEIMPYWDVGNGEDIFEGDNAVENLVIEQGVLTGKITDEETYPAFVWERGKLYLWKEGINLPLVVMEASTGKKLGQFVSHKWVPNEVIILQTSAHDLWYCVEAGNWNKPIKQAIKELRP